jgi:hypothetical protein
MILGQFEKAIHQQIHFDQNQKSTKIDQKRVKMT